MRRRTSARTPRHGSEYALHLAEPLPHQDRPARRGRYRLPYPCGEPHEAQPPNSRRLDLTCQRHEMSCWSVRRGIVRGRGRAARRRRRRAVPFGGPPFRRSGGVLVGPADGGVDVHVPGDQHLGVRLGLQLGEDPRPAAGTSRQGAPVRVRHRMPSMSCLRVHTCGRPGFMPRGSRGSSRAHWPFVRSPRPTGSDHQRTGSTFATDPRPSCTPPWRQQRCRPCSGLLWPRTPAVWVRR